LNNRGPACIADPNVSFRFYEIVVAVRDSAGNESSDTCTVIIEPKDGIRRTLKHDISGSSARYDLDSVSDLSWNHAKSPSAVPSTTPSASIEPSSMPTSEPTKEGKKSK
jgi:hypothetical protein